MRTAGWLTLASTMLVAGCGGGVNSAGTTPITPTTTTTTTPVVTPAINYNDAELARSNAATDASAISAYNAGAIGAGVKIAVLDSGLTDAHGEFAGRIDPASRSIVTGGTYADADPDGHGTSVAAVALAAHNGSDIEGLAFGATLLAIRSDVTGTCGTTDGCRFATNSLANGIDYATNNGARVINLSLGGGGATSQFRAAIGRATAAGVIVVISAGNDATADPDPLAQIAGDTAARGLVIIAGAHDATGAASTFTDKAGSYADYYISALGTRVRSFDATGTDYYFSGTSYSAPAVAGAIALLESAFPNLTAAQVVSLLYSSATDAGAAGVDTTFGHGLLNLTRAFQPIGTTSLAGSAVPVSLTENAVLSPAMGDATGTSFGRAVILDGYGRAFAVELGGTFGRTGPRRPLAQSIAGGVLTRDTSLPGMTMSLTVAQGTVGTPWAGLAQRGLTHEDTRALRPLTGSALVTLDRRTRIGFSFASGGHQLATQLDGDGTAGSFLVARGAADTPGFDARGGAALGVRHMLGQRLALTVAAEHGALPQRLGLATPAAGYTLATVAATRRIGPLALGIGGGVLDEQASVLGARFGAALGGRGATTYLLDLDGALTMPGGWQARARWRRGWTEAASGGALERGRLASGSASFDIGRVGQTNRFGLRFALPTRVTSGGFALQLPSGYDYATGAVDYAPATLSLTPQGREQDIEASLGFSAGPGWIDANLFLRRQPGNIAAAPDDRGAALRYGVRF